MCIWNRGRDTALHATLRSKPRRQNTLQLERDLSPLGAYCRPDNWVKFIFDPTGLKKIRKFLLLIFIFDPTGLKKIRKFLLHQGYIFLIFFKPVGLDIIHIRSYWLKENKKIFVIFPSLADGGRKYWLFL